MQETKQKRKQSSALTVAVVAVALSSALAIYGLVGKDSKWKSSKNVTSITHSLCCCVPYAYNIRFFPICY